MACTAHTSTRQHSSTAAQQHSSTAAQHLESGTLSRLLRGLLEEGEHDDACRDLAAAFPDVSTRTHAISGHLHA
eukprot:2368698-Rhodomonas_salina.2